MHRVFEEFHLNFGPAQTKIKDAIRRDGASRSRTAVERIRMTRNAKSSLNLAGEEAKRVMGRRVGT